MDLEVTVNLRGQHWKGGAVMEIPELYRECFEPLKTCDDAMVAYCTGDMIAASVSARTVMKTREDAAKILSKHIAEMLVAEMKKSDTYNGYPVNES